MGDNIFTATLDNGIYLTTNNSTNWTAVNSGLTDFPIVALAVHDGEILAGTGGSDIWRRPISEMTDPAIALPQREMPNRIHFAIGAQNRAGSMLAIELTVPHSEHVAVTIYNPAGKAVTSIVNKKIGAGSHRYLQDMHSFARGSYVVRLQAGATTSIKLVQIVH